MRLPDVQAQAMSTLHVVPVGDLIEHIPNDACVCIPSATVIRSEDGSVGWLLTHHSLDGREKMEG